MFHAPQTIRTPISQYLILDFATAYISYFDISQGSYLLISILANFLVQSCIFFRVGEIKSLHGLAIMFTSFLSSADYYTQPL